MIDEILKYPVGKFKRPEIITSELLNQYINIISLFPEKLQQAVFDLNDEQLNTEYRPEGWTIRQLINHCADSHANSLIRFKLALTEDNPIVKPYLEAEWAKLADSTSIPIAPAFKMLEGIHERWVVLLNNMSESDFLRAFVNPQNGKQFTLAVATALYAWHCDHHLAHVTTLKKNKGW